MLGFMKGLHEVMSKSSNVKRTNMSDHKSVKPRLNDVALFLQEIGNKEMGIAQKEDEHPHSSPIRLIIEHAKESASDTFKKNLPKDILDRVPDNYIYQIGIPLYIIAICLFFFFGFYNYTSAVDQKFISIVDTSNECSNVDKAVSGEHFLDSNLYWDNEKEYIASQAVFKIKLNTFRNTVSDITIAGIKSKIYNAMIAFAELKTHNLAYSILLSITYYRYLGTLKNHYLQTTGESSSIYLLSDYSLVTASSAKGICDQDGIINYDLSRSQVHFIWNNSTELKSCDAMNLIVDIYNKSNDEPIPNKSLFSKKVFLLDTHTFTITTSINLGYNLLSDLTYVYNEKETKFQFNGLGYTIKEYTDLRYSMNDLFCAVNDTEAPENSITELCFVQAFPLHVYSLPIFNHIGNSFLHPDYCDCSIPEVGQSDKCNLFNLMSGKLYFNRKHKDETFADDAIRLMILRSRFESYDALNKAAYSAQFYSYDTSLTENNPNKLVSAFDFCSIQSSSDEEHCSMINLYNIQDPGQPNFVVSRMLGFKQFEGSCKNFYKFNDNVTADSRALFPPIDIFEKYYECYPTKLNTLTAAVGQAFGNFSLVMLLLGFILAPILSILFLNETKKPKYTDSQIQDACSKVGEAILLVKDGYHNSIDPDGVLFKLNDELTRIEEADDDVSVMPSSKVIASRVGSKLSRVFIDNAIDF